MGLSRSFPRGTVRRGVVFSCWMRELLGCKVTITPVGWASVLWDGLLCCGLRHRGVPDPAGWGQGRCLDEQNQP